MNDLKIIFFGAGQAAQWIYKQIRSDRVVSVVDFLDENTRKIKEFNGYKVVHYSKEERIFDGEYTLLVALGNWNIATYIDEIIKYVGGNVEGRILLPNPYVSLRTFCRPKRFWDEVRIPYEDAKYRRVKELFRDDESVKIFGLLTGSVPWNNPEDEYQLVQYSDIKDMLYCKDDYWQSYEFTPNHGEYATVIDGGAFVGDSIRPILSSIPEKIIQYYAFEPDSECGKRIEREWNSVKIRGELSIFCSGLGEENGVAYFSESDIDNGGFIDDEGSDQISIVAIDELDIKIQGQLYIKMDIEGSELDALKGAKSTIMKYRPYMAICVYHRKNDLVDIPLYLKEMSLGYKFYLRGGSHTILWAIPDKCDE